MPRNLVMIKSTAKISGCGLYRYSLTRIWDKDKPKVMFIMLNPSTADGERDDPTIRRCIGYARDWGYGGFYVCNLFGYRATEPTDLLNVKDPIGELNLDYIKAKSKKVDKVVCAWGNKPILKRLLQDTSALEMLKFIKHKLYFLELSKEGVPKHPLYLKSELKPIKWN